MATTDARSGFRLPWSSDRQTDTSEEPATESKADVATTATETVAPVEPGERRPAVDPWTGATVSPAVAPPDVVAPGDPTPVDATPVDAPPSAEAQVPAVETGAATPPNVASGASPAAPKAPPKKPNKFLADLTKAMQAAAEDARGRSVDQLHAEAKTHVEAIHARSSTESADLRRRADDDVAAVREWSKAEIARIREETEQRITDRKAQLDTEVEQHAAVIEREIAAVQRTVSDFEEEMAAFFERLLVEEDPTRFATMAENLPEPPTFDDLSAAAEAHAVVEAASEVAADADNLDSATGLDSVEGESEAVAPEATADAEAAVEAASADQPADASDGVDQDAGKPDTSEPSSAVDAPFAPEDETSPEGDTTAMAGADPVAPDPVAPDAEETSANASASDHGSTSADFAEAGDAGAGDGEDGEVDREAAFAAIQAAAEAAASAEVAADAAARAEAVADVAIEIMGHESEEADPRFAALGLNPDDPADFVAAADGASGETIPTIGDDALAARLDGLVPGQDAPAPTAATTQVIVVGLVSVASIASFKRHLGRIPGVLSVGVSSGPEGEFVFAVTHAADAALRDAIPSLPSFQARISNAADGVINVTAHDPETDG